MPTSLHWGWISAGLTRKFHGWPAADPFSNMANRTFDPFASELSYLRFSLFKMPSYLIPLTMSYVFLKFSDFQPCVILYFNVLCTTIYFSNFIAYFIADGFICAVPHVSIYEIQLVAKLTGSCESRKNIYQTYIFGSSGASNRIIKINTDSR